jgi:uncharacterized protein
VHLMSTDLVELKDIRKKNLGDLVSLYEYNYILINKLAPDIQSQQGGRVSRVSQQLDLYMSVLNTSKYTTTIKLTYFFREEYNIKHIPDIRIKIYHDARLAEVLLLDDSGVNYDVPFNEKIFCSLFVKKWKINSFLNKWLHYCLKQGHQFCIENKI